MGPRRFFRRFFIIFRRRLHVLEGSQKQRAGVFSRLILSLAVLGALSSFLFAMSLWNSILLFSTTECSNFLIFLFVFHVRYRRYQSPACLIFVRSHSSFLLRVFSCAAVSSVATADFLSFSDRYLCP